MALLERRLDNVITHLGFAVSRPSARQLIRHGHILINGRKTDIPSYLVKPGDIIKVKDREGSRRLVAGALSMEGHAAGPRLARPRQHRARPRPGSAGCRRSRTSPCRSPRS